MTDFVKLSSLVGSTFKVADVTGYTYKIWDATTNKMLTSDKYQEGYRKLYQVITNKGQLDMGPGQLGSLLEAVFYKGKADLVGQTFEVKSNGKSGIDIRYYFNVVRNQPVDKVAEVSDEAISLDDIPY